MTIMWANVALIHAANIAIETHETVCNQNINLCDNDNDSDDTDEKYVNSGSYNLFDVLATLMKMWDKLQSNTKNKNKKIIQKWIKKKWYCQASKKLKDYDSSINKYCIDLCDWCCNWNIWNYL